jgi:type II secretory pathway component PulM
MAGGGCWRAGRAHDIAAINIAEKELGVATERRGRLEARAVLVKGTPKVEPSATSSAPIADLGSFIGESAAAAGFEPADGAAAGDEYAFRLASAKAGPLMLWLTGLEAQGIELAEIKLRAGEGGYVAADIRLRKKS